MCRIREVYKRVSAGTLGRGAEMKGGAGNHVNTAGVCVYTCVRVRVYLVYIQQENSRQLPTFSQHKRITSCSFGGV